jgi:gamma-glutamyltranspeptidase/glutathione hydrolase
MRAGVAAGHPATAEAGVEILAEGGSAADAAVAASLVSCVAETVMTGLLGGGHALYFDAAAGTVENLDCFVSVPGLGAPLRRPALVELQVPFGAELVHYAVGPASCAVPGVPAGLDALWSRFGRLPWPRLCEPALAVARAGVVMPPAHAACLEMLAPVMTMNEGAAIYSPQGRVLAAGDRLHQPGLVRALELLADEGPRSVYSGTVARCLLELVGERGGLLTRDDLAAYEPHWSAPVSVAYAGARVLSRAALAPLSEPLGRLRPLAGLGAAERALALVQALTGERRPSALADTTNLTVVDVEGNACVLTTSLGLGSGDFVPGLDLHLNSMLGETDLLRGELEPGARMPSMMAPTLVLARAGRPVLAAGAAGGTRLRSALVQVLAGVLDEGLDVADAVARPRLHPAGAVVHLEPGFAPDVATALQGAGYQVRTWPAQHHYFGGVSAITPEGGAGDPRRSGAARMLPDTARP